MGDFVIDKFEQARTEMLDFEHKLTTGELTEDWKDKRDIWLSRVSAAKNPHDLALCLVGFSSYIYIGYKAIGC